MTLKEQIIELNRTENAQQIRKLADRLRLGYRGVQFNYAETRELFARCDPTIDASRFEELMQLADSA
jgi:hypothetical protein